MHPQAHAFITRCVQEAGLAGGNILDLGGRIVMGTVHDLFFTKPTVVDIEPGPGVDIVADAATWQPDREYDGVLITEVFEHTSAWREILTTAYTALRPGGTLIATMASRDRPPHSGNTGGTLEPDAWYQNIDPIDLTAALAGWSQYSVTAADGVFGNDDLYCMAIR